MEKPVDLSFPPTCPDSEKLWRVAMGLIEKDEAIARHLSVCSQCWRNFERHVKNDFQSLLQTPVVRHTVPDEVPVVDRPRVLPDPGLISKAFPAEFDVIRHLGRGGTGDVFECFDRRLRRSVAVKVLRSEHLTSQQVRRIEHEARLQARINHPNFVQVFEVSDATGVPCITMELVEGGSLRDRIAEHPLSPRIAARVIAVVARAVDYAHQQGLIHRDLKPSNILLTSGPLVDQPSGSSISPSMTQPEAVPKIADFGLAKIIGETSEFSQPDVMVGTPAYLAPELVAGRSSAQSTASDIYSLGVILYESLTGTQPFQGDTIVRTLAMVETANPVSPRLLQPGINRDLETICLKCLSKDPRSRYATALALSEDLYGFLEGRPIRARPISTAKRFLQWSSRNRSLTAAIAASVMMATFMVVSSLLFAWEQRRLKQIAEDNLLRAQHSEKLALDSEKRALDSEAKATSLRSRSIPLFTMNINGSYLLAKSLLSTNVQELNSDKYEEMKQLAIGNLKTLHQQIFSDPELVEAAPVMAMEVLIFAAYLEEVAGNTEHSFQLFKQILEISTRHPSHDPHQLELQIQTGNHVAFHYQRIQDYDRAVESLADCWRMCRNIPPSVYCGHPELEQAMQIVSNNYLDGLRWKMLNDRVAAVTAELEQLKQEIKRACSPAQ